MPYRMVPRVPLLTVFDRQGMLWNHYQQDIVVGGNARVAGPYIPWLNTQQRESFLRNGLVEEIGAEPVVAPEPEPPVAVPVASDPVEEVYAGDADDGDPLTANGELVAECLADLARLDVALDSGAPTCRKALRDKGLRYGNEIIAAAVRTRRAAAALAGTAQL